MQPVPIDQPSGSQQDLLSLLAQTAQLPSALQSHGSALALACHTILINDGLRLRAAPRQGFSFFPRSRSIFVPPAAWAEAGGGSEWQFIYYSPHSLLPITLTVNLHAESGR